MSAIFLKLGGSLLTDKRQAEAPRYDVIRRLAAEIAVARRMDPNLRLVIGHGSGSFGHVYGKRYGTRNGVHTPEEWQGFALTADAAARLNRLIVGALLAAGIPAWGIQPSMTLRCVDGRVMAGPIESIELALARGLQPVIFGDVAIDEVRGGTIVSTEEIFEWLADPLQPNRFILAGEVDGVYTSDPLLDAAARLIPTITPETLKSIEDGLRGSHGVDVTGGMAAKVAQAMDMIGRHRGLEVIICSGLQDGNLLRVLTGSDVPIGTRISG